MATKRKRDDRTDLQRATDYIGRIRDALCLAHWKIVVRDADHSEQPLTGYDDGLGAAAMIQPLESRHVAILSLFPAYYEQDAAERRQIIAHELTHLTFAEVQFAGAAFENATDELSWRHLDRHFCLAIERAVDMVAALIAPTLPLPD